MPLSTLVMGDPSNTAANSLAQRLGNIQLKFMCFAIIWSAALWSSSMHFKATYQCLYIVQLQLLPTVFLPRETFPFNMIKSINYTFNLRKVML